jgi:hypothetical protein
MLTKWLMLIRAILFPLGTFYWLMSKQNGYQWQSDTWNINGAIFSNKELQMILKSNGELYRITTKDNHVTLDLIPTEK